jgi:hypothetical protein
MRTLTVAGRRWGWSIRREREIYPGHVVVSIWLESERGGAAKLVVRVRFDDPWLNYGPMITAPPERFAEVFATAPVTPKRVAAAIEQALALGWDPLARGTITPAHLEGDVLRLTASASPP